MESDGETINDLMAFVSEISSSRKRRADENTDKPASDGVLPNRKRRMLRERVEAGVEGEFGAQAASGSKLQLNHFLTPLESTSSIQALRKSTKILAKNDVLAAPLPQRTQERLDREAAYEQTKGEVDKWRPTMKRIKEANHLSFPLQIPQQVNPSNAELTAKFRPSTELESAVDKLLRAAEVRDETDITQTETLLMNHLSVDEIAQRRAELRQMRELIFRAEAKAKRVAKIKSKTYRKIQRKSREKVKRLIKEADGLDVAEDVDSEDRMKREMERARERATLRHKNTGKWAKAMKGRGELEADQRREIEEMLEKGEKLRSRIQGADGSEDDVDDDTDRDLDDIKAVALGELEGLDRDDDVDASKDPGRGVFSMKFMQNAMTREAKRIGEAVNEFRDEMTRMDGGDEVAVEDDDMVEEVHGVQSQRVGGRMTFQPGQTKIVASLPMEPSDSSSTLKSEPAQKSPAVTIFSSPSAVQDDPTTAFSSPLEPRKPETDINPWLQPQDSAPRKSRQKNEALIGKDVAGADKLKNRLKKRLKKMPEERETAQDDAVVEISPENVLRLPNELTDNEVFKIKSAKATSKEKASNGQQVDAAFVNSDSDSEVEAQEQQIKIKAKGRSVNTFKQRDLVALAFAGDNVVQDFDELKKREVEADAPREEDLTLPGWGSWGGTGIRPNPKAKKFITKIAGIDPTSRADHGKPHILISEKRDKKAAKYLVKDLPYPYTSKTQYEKSMEVPIGTEWNTRVGFQRQTLPRVVKKMGTVIDPLEKLF